MASNLPYMNTPGSLPKILTKICEASVPDNFNVDFLGTKLGFPGGNQRMFISWAKKCGFLNTDSTPTQLYKDYRNPRYRAKTMAKAIKIGYSDVYERNEYAQDLSRSEFLKLISEITGSPHDSSTVKAIVGTFWLAKDLADFEPGNDAPKEVEKDTESPPPKESTAVAPEKTVKKLNLGLSYTINLVLPKTDDPAVYAAIFKSLKDNLLDD